MHEQHNENETRESSAEAALDDLTPGEEQSQDVKGGALNAYGPKQERGGNYQHNEVAAVDDGL